MFDFNNFVFFGSTGVAHARVWFIVLRDGCASKEAACSQSTTEVNSILSVVRVKHMKARNDRVAGAVRLAIALGSASAAALSGAAMAQEAEPVEIQQVIVTGSRIVRDANVEAPTAVVTIDAEAIEESGLINVADVLRTVPSFGVSGLSSGNSNFFTTSSGINTLQLRNLGEDRTLVLVNGRRYVSGLAGSSAVDFNTIPTELIDRIEVITGGASAVYGSDALAGVINIILKKDFEGLNFSYQYGESEAGGEITNRYNVLMGGNFADGRGNAVISATYSENRGTFARQYENTKVDDVAACLLFGLANAPCTESFAPFYSSFSESGRFFAPDLGTAGGSFSINAQGQPVTYSSATYGFNRQAFRRYTIPTERYLLSSVMDFEVTDSVTAFAEAMFAQTRTQSDLEPFPHSNSDLSTGGIPLDNPFVTQAMRDRVLGYDPNATSIGYFRRMTEIGGRGASAKRNTVRLAAGLDGQLPGDWTWNAFMSYGRMDDSQQGGGQINVASMREALNAEIGPDGNPRCRNEYARIEGCVPINLFGLGSITPAAAKYVSAPSSRQQLTEQKVVGASVSGELFQLPSGPLSVVVGLEYRDEKAEDVPDVLTQAGLNAGNAEAPTFGGYTVKEAFVEFEMPIIDSLSIGGAARFADYSTSGETEAFAGRLVWSPLESLKFRAQAARAVRAPNIGELFAPGGENFATVQDPCNNITAASTGNVAENCRSVPSIAARIAATGSFTLTQPEIQGTGGFTGKGNLLLTPEEADTLSLGVVWDGDVPVVGPITASIDYFKIEVDNAIGTVGRQAAINFCYNADPANFPNNFCDLIVRDTRGNAIQQGEITEVNSGFINEGTEVTEGIDLALTWAHAFDNWGSLGVRVNYVHLLELGGESFGVKGDSVGVVGGFEDKIQAGLRYNYGPATASWEWTYYSSAVVSSTVDYGFKVPAYDLHDARVAVNLGDLPSLASTPLANSQLYVGVNNVFDEDAPIILTGIPGNTTGTDTNASVYSPIGRSFYVGFRQRF